ncbi:energy transducer TonB [Sulfuricurvum sp.]|uniref:energy transducer TonB n=1 Tax=Sulfuricurvum sp. TaxID=2025608 RepID=UPI0025E4E306|nr:energy transducer TonB [Sulfuricurvum sp.]
MKTKRSFLFSLLLHAGIFTGAVALSTLIKEEKEEEIVLELSLDSAAQIQPVSTVLSSKKMTLSKSIAPSTDEIIEKTEPKPLIQKTESLQMFPKEVIEDPKPTLTAQTTSMQIPAKETVFASNPPILAPQSINIEEQYLDDHLSTIRDLLVKYRKYPSQAVRLKQEGAVQVTFRLKQNGEVEDIRIIGSSGYELLDGDAMALVQKTSEYFPKPPKTIRITVPLNYVLKVRT